MVKENFPGNRRKKFLLSFSLYTLPFVLTFISSCATVHYNPPFQGTSAELQSALAQSLERNLKDIPFDPSGKLVDLQVYTLGSFQGQEGLENYVKSLFQEWIVREGGKVGPGQLQMVVFMPVLGTTAVRRDFSYQNIPLFYSERFQATARLLVLIKNPQGEIIKTWQKKEGAGLSDIYLLRIFGPFDIPR